MASEKWQCFYSSRGVLILGIVSITYLTLPEVSANNNVPQVVAGKNNEQYCSFFANRAPNIQLGLKNCTWFKENSCCRQEEINAIFPRVKPLRGASPACQRFTNYLMCYVCSPDQNLFYEMESLTVCEEFCDAWYDACQNAILKGSVIKQLYSNGSEYCDSRRFKVNSTMYGKCFFFDAKYDKSFASSVTISSFLFVGTIVFGLIGSFFSYFVAFFTCMPLRPHPKHL